MSLGRRPVKMLDGEMIFRHYYVEMGDGRSYGKLARWASEKWGKNPLTGKNYSPSAVWQSGWKWAFKNLDKARQIYAEVYLRYGETLTDDIWMKLVSQHAKTCMTRTQYKKFFARNPEFRPYELMR